MHAVQFWSIATLMVVATTAFLVVPIFWRAHPDGGRPRRWPAFAIAAALPLIALGIYAVFGSPDALEDSPDPARFAGADAMRAHARSGTGRDGGDLDAAVEKLRARLAAQPDDAAGWRLLAQSYQFQGRDSDAASASQRADALDGGAAAAAPATIPPTPSAAMGKPLDAAALRIAERAQTHRRKREFKAAIVDFAELARRGTMTADLWADYADALGSDRGSLDGEAAKCIAAALRLDPEHPKALWLDASRLTERGDYRGALSVWNSLAAVLPPDSPDARVIAANMAEAREKSAATAPAARATAVALRGSVRLDPRWAADVPPGTTLFIFARAADERGPPLAVLRTTAGPWPVRFSLDDTNAMMPTRTLSNYSRVIVEARISRSGNALAQPDDLRAVSAVLDPRSAADQALTIAERVGPAGEAQGS